MSHMVIEAQGSKTCAPVIEAGLETFCPSRFWQDLTVLKYICTHILKAASLDECKLVKEVDFMQGVQRMSDVGAGGAQPLSSGVEDGDEEGVGRIDMVLMRLDAAGTVVDWCAVEMQAVYFSGDGMSEYFTGLGEHAVLTAPIGKRRGDYRSSGPKRLMPQLQVKVPSLRRWGKKMVVVVDRRFFSTLGAMRRANHVSNSDIIWCVVDYDFSDATGASTKDAGSIAKISIRVDELFATTLEASIDGLTAGEAISRDLFEAKIIEKRDAWIRLT